ncbi:MAG: hypothetical protein IH859_09995 [Chloroflexi bacterium]|nr:hypothetical protein [Chloroflexota bacterium]
MISSTLQPFIRKNLDILFVGLNPSFGSSEKGHYFSVKQSLWNQLYQSRLITISIDKVYADEVVFGSTKINFHGWSYGITDLVSEIAESDSRKIRTNTQHCVDFEQLIRKYRPGVAILLHKKVLKAFSEYLGIITPRANQGQLGNLLHGCSTIFYSIAFPHGNNIPDQKKIEKYLLIKKVLQER